MSDEEESEQETYEVEAIVKTRIRGGHREYFLKWKGYPDSENTWEPAESLDCDALLESFHASLEAKKAQSVPKPRTRPPDPDPARIAALEPDFIVKPPPPRKVEEKPIKKSEGPRPVAKRKTEKTLKEVQPMTLPGDQTVVRVVDGYLIQGEKGFQLFYTMQFADGAQRTMTADEAKKIKRSAIADFLMEKLIHPAPFLFAQFK
jgi:chromobox protein 5